MIATLAITQTLPPKKKHWWELSHLSMDGSIACPWEAEPIKLGKASMYHKRSFLIAKNKRSLKRKIATLEVHPANMKKTRSGIESSSATTPPCTPPPLMSKTSTIAQLVKC